MAIQGNIERRRNTPVAFPKTTRPDFRALKTSARAGVVMPGGFIPLMPQDSIRAGSTVTLNVLMEPTVRMLANAVHVRAHAYFVGYPALDRFDGLDSVANAWAEKAGAESIRDAVAFSTATHGEFYDAFGQHIAEGENFDTLYHRAYNQVINYRRQVVSESLPVRTETDCTLARALWGTTALARVVPDFDAALIEASAGVVFDAGKIPVMGLGLHDTNHTFTSTTRTVKEAGGVDTTYTDNQMVGDDVNARVMYIEEDPDNAGYPNLYADLTAMSGEISLAKIDQAKKLKSFAQTRAQMAGTDDDLINLLMQGISIPNAAYRQPVLIGTGSGIIGQSKHRATDAANLEEFMVDGAAQINMRLALPEQMTGGVVVMTYEIIPEPVFDRQADLFLHKTKEQLPNALRDYLDIQPVAVVPNKFVDALHSTPEGTFGYAPLNYDWARRSVAVGGRFMRKAGVTATDEDQQHIWSVREVDPVLDEDTFLVPADLEHNVFRDTTVDTFFVRHDHNAVIQGITQFAPALYESTGEYEAVVAEVDDTLVIPPSAT